MPRQYFIELRLRKPSFTLESDASPTDAAIEAITSNQNNLRAVVAWIDDDGVTREKTVAIIPNKPAPPKASRGSPAKPKRPRRAKPVLNTEHEGLPVQEKCGGQCDGCDE